MEKEAPSSHQKVSTECNEKDPIVVVLKAVENAFDTQVHE